jgi:glutamate racemase
MAKSFPSTGHNAPAARGNIGSTIATHCSRTGFAICDGAMDASQPLLFLDPGVGGLSILGPVRKLLPNAPVVYAMDQAGYPYGQKNEAELTARVPALLGRIAEHVNARLIVIACNTASVIALDPVRKALHLPIVGTVPAIKPAAAISKTRVIGVLGTRATVRQPYVDDLSREFASDCTVLRFGSHDLVALAEKKFRGEPTDIGDYAHILDGLFDQPRGDEIDTIVLACTHFPLVEEELAAAAGRPIAFVHGGDGIARRVAHLTKDQPWPHTPPPGKAIFISDGSDVEPLKPGLGRYGITEFEVLQG